MNLLARVLVLLASTWISTGAPSTAKQFHFFTGVAGLSDYRATSGDPHGPGGVFADLNNDGYPDLVLSTGASAVLAVYKSVPRSTISLPVSGHLSVPTREFELVSYLTNSLCGSVGAVAGDYDNDGDLDIYAVRHPFNKLPLTLCTNRLLKNRFIETGHLVFQDVTDSTDPTPGIADSQFGLSHSEHSGVILDNALTAAWADIDRDGNLDLYVGNHDGSVDEVHEASIPGQRDILYRNNGDGTFTDISAETGVTGFVSESGQPECFGTGGGFQRYSSSNAVIFSDLNNDGWPDLYVTNKTNNPGCDSDMLYTNLGRTKAQADWRGFQNITYSLPYPFGRVSHNAMGIDSGDFDNDGDFDLYITDLECPNGQCVEDPPNDLLINTKAGNRKIGFSISSEVAAVFSWGVKWVDVNNDGHLDIHVATGRRAPNDHFPNFLYLWDSNQEMFVEQANSLGLDWRGNSRGNLSADYNRDGAVDLLVINLNDSSSLEHQSVLHHNMLEAGSSSQHFLNIKLVGDPSLEPRPPCVSHRSSRDAIGARVIVEADFDGDGVFTLQKREVISGSGNAASTSSLELHFGLGHASFAASVIVSWPSGRSTQIFGVQADQFLTITETDYFTPCHIDPT